MEFEERVQFIEVIMNTLSLATLKELQDYAVYLHQKEMRSVNEVTA